MINDSSWYRKHLGAPYRLEVQRRQVKPGRKKEPVVVISLMEDMKAGDELVMLRRNVRFAAIGVDYEERQNDVT
jgi:hypothetical protein